MVTFWSLRLLLFAVRPATLLALMSEIDLRERMLHRYSRTVVPVSNITGKGPMNVQVGLKLVRLENLDIIQRTLSVSVWLRLYWEDPRLNYSGKTLDPEWDSERQMMGWSTQSIWVPDVNIMQASSSEPSAYGETGVYLYDDEFRSKHGYNAFWSRPGVWHIRCPVDLGWFPFDVQTCDTNIESWQYNGYKVVVSAATSAVSWDTSQVMENMEYELKTAGFTGSTTIDYASPGTSGWPTLGFSISLQRFPQFYMTTVVVPLGLLVSLGCLTLWLPSESGERVSFSVTMLLTVFATMLFTAESRPSVRQDTWLDRYIAWCTSLAVVPVFESAFYSSILSFRREMKDVVEENEDTEPALGPEAQEQKAGHDEEEVKSFGFSSERSSLGNEASPQDPKGVLTEAPAEPTTPSSSRPSTFLASSSERDCKEDSGLRISRAKTVASAMSSASSSHRKSRSADTVGSTTLAGLNGAAARRAALFSKSQVKFFMTEISNCIDNCDFLCKMAFPVVVLWRFWSFRNEIVEHTGSDPFYGDFKFTTATGVQMAVCTFLICWFSLLLLGAFSVSILSLLRSHNVCFRQSPTTMQAHIPEDDGSQSAPVLVHASSKAAAAATGGTLRQRTVTAPPQRAPPPVPAPAHSDLKPEASGDAPVHEMPAIQRMDPQANGFHGSTASPATLDPKPSAVVLFTL